MQFIGWCISQKKKGSSYSDLITFVEDRLGHDYRYGLNISKIENELGWSPKENFDSGINKTVEWYLKKIKWPLQKKQKKLKF